VKDYHGHVPHNSIFRTARAGEKEGFV